MVVGAIQKIDGGNSLTNKILAIPDLELILAPFFKPDIAFRFRMGGRIAIETSGRSTLPC